MPAVVADKPRIPFLAYAQLVRLPNVFTALADIVLGLMATGAVSAEGWPSPLVCLALLGSSACLYCSGMVWNDVFDLEQDRRERPFRPIPSGRIPLMEAIRLGILLLGAGLCLAVFAGWQASGWSGRPAVLAGLLAAAIFLYDGWLKRTWAGPGGMGLCRFLNVLLGLSAAAGELPSWGMHLAVVVGLYIVGVTWFARTEASASRRSALVGGAVLMLAALALALPLPVWFPAGTSSAAFVYLLVCLGFWVGIPAERAISRPTPPTVQAAVKRALMGLVILDATLATAVAGTAGLMILLLLLPALYLGRRLYST